MPEAETSGVLKGRHRQLLRNKPGSANHVMKDAVLTVYQRRCATLYNPIRPSMLNDRTIRPNVLRTNQCNFPKQRSTTADTFFE